MLALEGVAGVDMGVCVGELMLSEVLTRNGVMTTFGGACCNTLLATSLITVAPPPAFDDGARGDVILR